MAIFRISGVWQVGWWNLITSVRLIQVGNNKNDHFRYFLGVRVSLIVRLIEGVRLIPCFTVLNLAWSQQTPSHYLTYRCFPR